MPVVSRSALVPFAAVQMYQLVADVERYPEFLPWCRDASIVGRDGDTVEASLRVARGPLHKSFTTRNRMHDGELIEIRLVEGPFRYLEGRWHFAPLDADGCRVTLDLDFEFASRLMGRTLTPIFSEIADSMVDAFCRRAAELYGRS